MEPSFFVGFDRESASGVEGSSDPCYVIAAITRRVLWLSTDMLAGD